MWRRRTPKASRSVRATWSASPNSDIRRRRCASRRAGRSNVSQPKKPTTSPIRTMTPKAIVCATVRSWLRSVCLSEMNRPSAALPDGFALLGECGGALAGILGAEDRATDLTLFGPALLLAPVDGALDDLLRRDERERRVPDDLICELDGVV